MTIRVPDGNLPASVTSFVGRGRDLAEARRRLGAARLLTLTGVGGVGKTRLALEAAASATHFEDGVWLVDLAPVRDPSLAVNATATALGMPDLGTRPVIDQLAAFLAHRAPLIVLDNCEHLVDACAELIHTLLSASPGLGSRVILHVRASRRSWSPPFSNRSAATPSEPPLAPPAPDQRAEAFPTRVDLRGKRFAPAASPSGPHRKSAC
ncbi:AAA family ATPase [Streptomyces sp. NPDC001868]|uniref:AAA family ATPase n=1 Tax=Streptomyces sp. NPDC001868 TaxID=3154401 RepID=UPI00332E53B6